MPAQKGRALLIKKETTTPDTFATVATFTAKTMSINNQRIDTTVADATTPGGPLYAAGIDGVRSIALSGDGRAQGNAAEQELATLALADDPRDIFQIVVPGWGTYEAEFFLDQFDFGGEQDGDVTFSASLSSSGEITFTAE